MKQEKEYKRFIITKTTTEVKQSVSEVVAESEDEVMQNIGNPNISVDSYGGSKTLSAKEVIEVKPFE